MRWIAVLFLLPSICFGADWYVGPSSGEYGSEDGTSFANQFDGCDDLTGIAAGDTVYLDSTQTWYERCAIDSSFSGSAASRVSIRPYNNGRVTFDHTVSLDGGASFDTGPSYVTTGFNWSLVSGEVYKKTTAAYILILKEDGTRLTPVDCDDFTEGNAVAALSRGSFCTRSTGETLYYRASDGGTPATHALRANNQADTNLIGTVYITGSNINIQGIDCSDHYVNYTERNGCIAFGNPWNVTLTDSNASYSLDGITVDGGSNILIGNDVDDVTSTYNFSDGFYANGDPSPVNGLIVRGTYSNNAHSQFYTGTTLSWSQDGDGIGIGGAGGTLNNVLLEQIEVSDNGPRDVGNTASTGTGVFVGTVNSMSAQVSIRGFYVSGNHRSGINLDAGESGGFAGGHVSGGVVKENCETADASATAAGIAIDSDGVPISVTNVAFIGNTCRSALQVKNIAGNIPIIKNNAFLNNCRGSYSGDIWIENAIAGAPINEGYNSFYKSGTACDASVIINTTGTDYTLSTLGSWNATDLSIDPEIDSDGIPGAGSPLIDTGTSVFPCYSRWGTCFGQFDIGAYQNQTIPYGYTLKPKRRR